MNTIEISGYIIADNGISAIQQFKKKMKSVLEKNTITSMFTANDLEPAANKDRPFMVRCTVNEPK